MEDDHDCIDVNIDIGEDSESNNDGRDLQLEINNFCMYMGGFAEPPTLEQQRYCSSSHILFRKQLTI